MSVVRTHGAQTKIFTISLSEHFPHRHPVRQGTAGEDKDSKATNIATQICRRNQHSDQLGKGPCTNSQLPQLISINPTIKHKQTSYSIGACIHITKHERCTCSGLTLHVALIVDSFLGCISYVEAFPGCNKPEIFRPIVFRRVATSVLVAEVGLLDTLWASFTPCFFRQSFLRTALRT